MSLDDPHGRLQQRSKTSGLDGGRGAFEQEDVVVVHPRRRQRHVVAVLVLSLVRNLKDFEYERRRIRTITYPSGNGPTLK